MDERRTLRVAETIREELAEMIGYELDDPRIVDVGVTEVLLSPDLRVARVRVSLPSGDEQRAATLAALNRACPFLRAQISARLQLFRTPDFRFEADAEVSSGRRAASILKRIRKSRAKGSADPPPAAGSAPENSSDDET